MWLSKSQCDILLVILGDGFLSIDRTDVRIGYSKCIIQAVNYTEIVCLTQPSSVWYGNITVTILSVHNEALTALCTGNCEYKYDTDNTPSITAVMPTLVRNIITIVFILSSGLSSVLLGG